MDYSSYCLFYWTVTNKDESWKFSLTQTRLYIRLFHILVALSFKCVLFSVTTAGFGYMSAGGESDGDKLGEGCGSCSPSEHA